MYAPNQPRRIRFSPHALQRLGERGILRRWATAATATRPTCHGRYAIFVLTAEQLRQRFGQAFADGVRVIVDQIRAVVVTVHWLARGGE